MNDDTLANAFHVYSMDWSESGLRFYVDDQLIGEQAAPSGGFWDLGGFDGDNIYAANAMAPFDQEVQSPLWPAQSISNIVSQLPHDGVRSTRLLPV